MLGNGRLEALCFDGEKRLAHIRGKLRKKVWINQGDIILLSLRDYQDEKGDVILKYSADEARSLKAYGELPESAKINETDTYVLVFSDATRKRLCALDGYTDWRISGTVTRVWMTMWSSTRTEMAAATTKRSMWMRSRVGAVESHGDELTDSGQGRTLTMSSVSLALSGVGYGYRTLNEVNSMSIEQKS